MIWLYGNNDYYGLFDITEVEMRGIYHLYVLETNIQEDMFQCASYLKRDDLDQEGRPTSFADMESAAGIQLMTFLFPDKDWESLATEVNALRRKYYDMALH